MADADVVNVRYLVDDPAASVDFYTRHFGFVLRHNFSPAFADVVRGRLRLLDAEACDGSITDFGSVLSVWFTDPDGMELEVCCFRTGVPPEEVRDPIIQPVGSEEVS